MRRARFLMVTSALALSGAVLWASGCTPLGDECFSLDGVACKGSFGGGSSASTGTKSTTGTASGTMASSSTGMDPSCDPMVVSDKCGVFVAMAGKPGATGTMTDPFSSLGEGIAEAVAKNKYVYACADAFNEQVTIKSSVAIYGGREDCAKSWTLKVGGATTVNGPADKVALLIDTTGLVTLENVDVVALKAVGASASSIAVLVSQAEAEFTNCKFTSNDGMPGMAGSVIPPSTKLDGLPGMSGAGLCDPGTHKGGQAPPIMCSAGSVSMSGAGGDGGSVTGSLPSDAGNGTAGTPSDASMMGTGGAGEMGTVDCLVGKDGAKGIVGGDGLGALSIGSLTKSGYQGTTGAAGDVGKPGQGGGGGGGSKGVKAMLACSKMVNDDYPGASGGSGGTGGCGGLGGAGGQPGGSSIALVSIGAKVTLTTVTLTPGKGGNGGNGGPGQSGGAQGPIGSGGLGSGSISSGCNGGKGGAGGTGGPGGGGQGGHSLGLAYKGTAPTGMPVFPKPPPSPGVGGLAGTGATDLNVGNGVAGNSTAPASYMLEFK